MYKLCVRQNRIDLSTGGGLGAILLWSATFAFARSLSEQVGPITAGTAVYLIGGCLCLARLAWSRLMQLAYAAHPAVINVRTVSLNGGEKSQLPILTTQGVLTGTLAINYGPDFQIGDNRGSLVLLHMNGGSSDGYGTMIMGKVTVTADAVGTVTFGVATD